MLPCIACSRHVVDDDDVDVDDEDRAGSSSSSIAGPAETKTLTSQLKYVVLKISAGYRQCRPCSGFRAGNHTLGSEELFVGTSDASSSDGWSNNNKSRSSNQRGAVAGSDSEGTAKLGKVSSSPRSSGQLSCSTRNSNVTTRTEAAQIDDEEWVAQVEPGVLITFVPLPNGENELKRIRFSREMFNKWQAESWWSENCERVHELYNVAGSDHSFPNTRKEAAANGVSRLAEQQKTKDMNCSAEEDAKPKQDNIKSLQAADELTEWVEEDEPGVYITVKIGPNGRELKRVRFSREKFSEKQAKLWWEKNRFRIHDQYL